MECGFEARQTSGDKKCDFSGVTNYDSAWKKGAGTEARLVVW